MNSIINVEDMTVKVTHKTTCADTPKQLIGEERTVPEFTTTFDFSNTDMSVMLQWLADNRIIAWRAHNKVKDMSEVEVRAMDSTIDCSTFFAKKARSGKTALVKSIEALAEAANMTVEEFIADLQSKQ